MTTDPKVVQLVVDKRVEGAKPLELGIIMSAQIKYADDEVVLVKATVDVNGKRELTSHFVTAIPKE